MALMLLVCLLLSKDGFIDFLMERKTNELANLFGHREP
jgi:hypothetical protein